MIFFNYNTPLTPKTTNSSKNGQEPITDNALIFFVVRIPEVHMYVMICTCTYNKTILYQYVP